MKILYVDNNEVFAGVVISGFLKDHDVTRTDTVAGARRYLKEQSFDVILLENDLIGAKGCELLNDLKRRDVKIAVIGISSKDEDNQMLLEAGAVEICNKMNFDEVLELLEEIV